MQRVALHESGLAGAPAASPAAISLLEQVTLQHLFDLDQSFRGRSSAPARHGIMGSKRMQLEEQSLRAIATG